MYLLTKELEEQIMQNQKRKTLKKAAAVGGVLTTGAILPKEWVVPIVDSVMLPAHAQTSSLPGADDDDTATTDTDVTDTDTDTETETETADPRAADPVTPECPVVQHVYQRMPCDSIARRRLQRMHAMLGRTAPAVPSRSRCHTIFGPAKL